MVPRGLSAQPSPALPGAASKEPPEGPFADALSASAVSALATLLQQRFGPATRAILFYGSKLRNPADPTSGLFDLIVVLDTYRAAFGLGLKSLANRLLPPNVFYVETPFGTSKVRAKYATISWPHLARQVSPRCQQPYFWGRLSQPVSMAYARTPKEAESVGAVLRAAERTFCEKAAPIAPNPCTARALWVAGLAASYRTEFRPESSSRASEVIDRHLERCEQSTRRIADELGWPHSTCSETGETLFSPPIRPWVRRRSRWAWVWRRTSGRVLHILRLMKAAWTFQGGIDYLAWKIERHSGVPVEVSDRARRHPLIFGWWTLLRVWRRGGFR